MATEFTYSIASDTANGVVATDRLFLEVGASSIAPSMVGVDVAGDVLKTFFDADLSGPEEAALGVVVGNHKGNPVRTWAVLAREPEMEPVVPGASKVLANDRPAIEVQEGVTGYAAIQAVWPYPQDDDAEIRILVHFVLKAAGTGSNARIAARFKAQGPGEDSTAAFPVVDFAVVPVTHTTVGEVFKGELILDASVAHFEDAVALQVGRDGNNELGAGTNDDVNQAVQIIAIRMEAR